MFSILYNIAVSPIELVVELAFELMYRLVGHRAANEGIAVIGVSILISLLTLPLYRMADAVQKRGRDEQAKLSKWAGHIRKTFKGDERFMMLQAYYRINHYSPLQALKGAAPLMLQIPFFMAAYRFLSGLDALRGASFGPVRDLGLPDGIISFGPLRLNLLPILMTLVNVVASTIYTRDFPLKSRIQLYAFAAVFLMLLYRSPSGLVIYWTCNNIFSLIKNIFYRLKNPKKYAAVCCAVAGTVIAACLILCGSLNSRKKIFFVFLFQNVSLMPLLLSLIRLPAIKKPVPSVGIFISAGVSLMLLTGVLIPSAVIVSSPSEFVDPAAFQNPLYFLVHSACYAAGFFLLWPGIVYAMAGARTRSLLPFIFLLLLAISLADYFAFGRGLGIISPYLRFDRPPRYSSRENLANMVTIGVTVLLCSTLYAARRIRMIIPALCLALSLCLCSLSLTNIRRTQAEVSGMTFASGQADGGILHLSTKGRNVIVFMLDRAVSGYVPYMLEEKPILKKQFDGFTYYPNTLSHGFFTNFGSPALFGGYEYTVSEMNKRSDETLADKQNEALKVLPVLFHDNGFRVTVCDPPYAGYKDVPDLSIYDDYPEIAAYNTQGAYITEEMKESFGVQGIKADERNFFCYSVFKVSPICLQKRIYDDGKYFSSKAGYALDSATTVFLKPFSVLLSLVDLTVIEEDVPKNTFLMIDNTSSHEPCILRRPEYMPSVRKASSDYLTGADGRIRMGSEHVIGHYHVNMASFLQIGKWLDYMREQGCYDNTRIIIVADHGRGLGQFDNMLIGGDVGIDVEWCNPLLMVKDFGAKGFSVSDEFMTNADVPSLAVSGIISHPVNPFTGVLISDAEKHSHPQLVTSSGNWNIHKNNGNTFDTSDGHWFSVYDDIFKPENWKRLD